MALDNAKNFAKATVSTGYNSSATSVVLTTGHGAKMPTVPFNAVWWDSTLYSDPADDPNVEIVRVTARSTDTLTVTRAQEGTTATAKNTAGSTYKMIAGLTAAGIASILVGPTISDETVEQSTSSAYQRLLFQKANDDIEVRTMLRSVTTTDNVATVICSFTPGLPLDGLGGIATCRYVVTAIGTNFDEQESVACYEGFFTFRRVGEPSPALTDWWANVGQHGHSGVSRNSSGVPLAWTVSQAASSFNQTLEVKVTGGTGLNILWHGKFEWMWHHL